MKKGIALSLCALVATQVMGSKVDSNGRVMELADAKSISVGEKDYGNLSVQLKAMTVISDKNNGFAPSNGTGILAKLKYESADVLTEGLKFGIGTYVNGDAGLTKWDENNAAAGYNKGAYGMVVSPDGDTVGHVGELYVSYENKYVNAKFGRQTLDTPLTQIQISLMPNFYEAYMLSSDAIDGLKLTAGQITRMSYGSRAAPDSGIIGENTSTAGAVANLIRPTPGPIGQAQFYGMSQIAGFDENTNGRTVIGATYTGVKNLKLDAWIYHSDKIANDFYAEAGYTLPLSEGMNVNLNAQYLMQKDTGSALAGERDFNMMGAKAAIGTKKWGAFAAMNKSGDNDNVIAGQYFNVWGADPAYTSSIFSRNAYRTDVTAYKVGAHYVIMKGLKLMVNYANYGKSKSTMGGNMTPTGGTALTDATELDTVLVYKPNKEWMFKIFHALRTSEFDGRAAGALSSERQMSHIRAIASYSF